MSRYEIAAEIKRLTNDSKRTKNEFRRLCIA